MTGSVITIKTETCPVWFLFNLGQHPYQTISKYVRDIVCNNPKAQDKYHLLKMPFTRLSQSMPNTDQCGSKSWHWSKNASECQSLQINANQLTIRSMPEFWSALIGIGYWSTESCVQWKTFFSDSTGLEKDLFLDSVNNSVAHDQMIQLNAPAILEHCNPLADVDISMNPNTFNFWTAEYKIKMEYKLPRNVGQLW